MPTMLSSKDRQQYSAESNKLKLSLIEIVLGNSH